MTQPSPDEVSSESDADAPHGDGGAPPAGAAWPEVPGLVARGLCMGSADVVPGVSGGTMALVLGIYVRLVEAIRSIDARCARLLLTGRLRALSAHLHWRFLGAVACGQALGVVLFTKVVPLPVLLRTHPEPIYGLFFGLVAGSLVVLARPLLRDGVDAGLAGAGLAGLACGLAVVHTVPHETPEAPWFVFLCGCISICAMILPGISGSFVLLLLRKYALVLGAVGEVIHPAGEGGRLAPLLTVVLPFACGCVVGLLSFARFLGWLLRRAERATLAFMTGLLAGSLWILWPFQARSYLLVRGKERLVSSSPLLPSFDASAAAVLALALGGAVGVLVLDRLARLRRAA
ncbi:MAG: DUF368 domain-containing protein [Planctomycetota bacterium]|nr:MAG: DUF368 domain-containing protein [Planctomycetota bacterium]